MEPMTGLEQAVYQALKQTEQSGTLEDRARLVARLLRDEGCFMRPTLEKRLQALVNNGRVTLIDANGEVYSWVQFTAAQEGSRWNVVVSRDGEYADKDGPYETYADAKARCAVLTEHALHNPQAGLRVRELGE
jgi:hypothetical protein